MKTFSVLAIGVVVGLYGVSRADTAAQYGRGEQPRQPQNGICVYDRSNYQGRSECWDVGQNVPDLARQRNWSGQIASIRLFGRGVAVVYQRVGYRGVSWTVDRDMPALGAIRERVKGNGSGIFGNWEGRLSSLQVRAQRRNR